MGCGASAEGGVGTQRAPGREDAAREQALSAPDPYRFTTIAHAGRSILGPLSPESIDATIARLPRHGPGMGVIDIGCGKGELLARVLAHTGGSGIGVEPNPAFAAEARSRVKRTQDPAGVRIVDSPYDPSLLPRGSFDLAICTGAIHAFGNWKDALDGITYLVAAGGWALVAPGYWKQRPAREYLAAIDGDEGEQDSLAVTLSAAEAAGWNVIADHESTVEEWDDYEHTYAHNVHAWCDANPGDPETPAYRARIDRWASAYKKWGRETMGYVLLLMQRTP